MTHYYDRKHTARFFRVRDYTNASTKSAEHGPAHMADHPIEYIRNARSHAGGEQFQVRFRGLKAEHDQWLQVGELGDAPHDCCSRGRQENMTAYGRRGPKTANGHLADRPPAARLDNHSTPVFERIFYPLTLTLSLNIIAVMPKEKTTAELAAEAAAAAAEKVANAAQVVRIEKKQSYILGILENGCKTMDEQELRLDIALDELQYIYDLSEQPNRPEWMFKLDEAGVLMEQATDHVWDKMGVPERIWWLREGRAFCYITSGPRAANASGLPLARAGPGRKSSRAPAVGSWLMLRALFGTDLNKQKWFRNLSNAEREYLCSVNRSIIKTEWETATNAVQARMPTDDSGKKITPKREPGKPPTAPQGPPEEPTVELSSDEDKPLFKKPRTNRPGGDEPDTPTTPTPNEKRKPTIPKPVIPKPVIPKPVIPKPIISKPTIPKPVIPEPTIPKPIAPAPAITGTPKPKEKKEVTFDSKPDSDDGVSTTTNTTFTSDVFKGWMQEEQVAVCDFVDDGSVEHSYFERILNGMKQNGVRRGEAGNCAMAFLVRRLLRAHDPTSMRQQRDWNSRAKEILRKYPNMRIDHAVAAASNEREVLWEGDENENEAMEQWAQGWLAYRAKQ
ncbi:hypothetical protein PWT90_03758 [Aphanocladium album]|nr:hypothetical protein PWT90_03758 [Aphanocladium album]